MSKKFADIRVSFTVAFEDDEGLELEAQALEAAWSLSIDPHRMEMEVVGPVRDTESAPQIAVEYPATWLTDEELFAEIKHRHGEHFGNDLRRMISEVGKAIKAEVSAIEKENKAP